MADQDADILAQFQEFLSAKAQQEKDAEDSEDYEVEVWDKDGRGARVRRSHAKPFLQSLGIDVDPPTSDGKGDKTGDDKGGDKAKSDRKSTGRQSSGNGAGGTARKYFTKP